MYQHAGAVLQPPSIGQLQLASIPTEPQAIFVYVLLVLALWAIWRGNRGPEPSEDHRSDASTQEPKKTDSPTPSDRGKRGARKKSRRRQGHISWIQ